MIDIIIPAFNAKETINKTILSVCSQTIIKKLKIFIINDCSDYTYEEQIELFKDKVDICELKLSKNMGPGYARQYGIDHSKNEYIYFLDADDIFIDCFALENLYNKIGQNDIICGNVFYEDENNEIKAISNNYSFQLHGKLYSRKYIDEYKFSFNNSRNGEDNCFNRLLKIGTDNYVYCDNNILLYSYQKNSITDSKNYMLNEIDKLTYNMLWMCEEAKKRSFKSKKIAFELLSELVHFTNVFSMYFDSSENINSIYKGFNKILESLKELNIDINKELLYDIYKNSTDNYLDWKRFYFIFSRILGKDNWTYE